MQGMISKLQVICEGSNATGGFAFQKASKAEPWCFHLLLAWKSSWTKGGVADDQDAMMLMWRDCNEVRRTILTAYLSSPWQPICITFAPQMLQSFL